MKLVLEHTRLGITRASSRACGSDRELFMLRLPWGKEDFGEGAEISTRGACGPQSFRFAARGTRST